MWSLWGADGSRKSEDSLAIFDTVPGGLRLTSPLFDDLGNFLERLEHAANVAGSEALISAMTAERAKLWLDALSPSQGLHISHYAANDTDRLVYAPNSEVLVRLHGNLLSRVLIAPELVNISDQDQLMYRYNLDGGGTGLVAASSIVDVAGDCQQVPLGLQFRHYEGTRGMNDNEPNQSAMSAAIHRRYAIIGVSNKNPSQEDFLRSGDYGLKRHGSNNRCRI